MSFKTTVLGFLKGVAIEEANNLRELAVKGAKQLAEQEIEALKTNHGVLVNDLNHLVENLKKVVKDVQWELHEKSAKLTNTESELVKRESAVKKADEIAAKALQSLRERHPVLTVHTTKHQDKAGRVYYTADVFSNGEPAHISKGRISLKDINTMAERLGATIVRENTDAS